MEKVFEIYIKTTPERLWDAITDPEIRAEYNFGAGGSLPNGRSGRVIEMAVPDPRASCLSAKVRCSRSTRRAGSCTRCSRSFSEEAKAEGENESHVGHRAGRRLGAAGRLTHDQTREGVNPEIYGGWPMVLSGLKTWLETGELLTTPRITHVRRVILANLERGCVANIVAAVRWTDELAPPQDGLSVRVDRERAKDYSTSSGGPVERRCATGRVDDLPVGGGTGRRSMPPAAVTSEQRGGGPAMNVPNGTGAVSGGQLGTAYQLAVPMKGS